MITHAFVKIVMELGWTIWDSEFFFFFITWICISFLLYFLIKLCMYRNESERCCVMLVEC